MEFDEIKNLSFEYEAEVLANNEEEMRRVLEPFTPIIDKIAKQIHWNHKGKDGRSKVSIPHIGLLSERSTETLYKMMLYQQGVDSGNRAPLTEDNYNFYAYMTYDSTIGYVLVTLDGKKYRVEGSQKLDKLSSIAFNSGNLIYSPNEVKSYLMWDFKESPDYDIIRRKYAPDDVSPLPFITPSIDVPTDILEEMAEYQRDVIKRKIVPYDLKDINGLAYQDIDFFHHEVKNVMLSGAVTIYKSDNYFNDVIKESFEHKEPVDL